MRRNEYQLNGQVCIEILERLKKELVRWREENKKELTYGFGGKLTHESIDSGRE